MTSIFSADCLNGKVALVTGGHSGIGFGIARCFGSCGAKVVVMGRRANVLEDAVAVLESEGIEASHVRGDVRSEESCEAAVAAAVAKFGKLDILVNCAAGNFLSPAEALTSKGFKTVMEIDCVGSFNMALASFPYLQEAGAASGDAVIINITAGFDLPPFFQVHASAAKMGVNSLTRSFALEWGDYGIRSIGVSPGAIADTAGTAKLGGMGGNKGGGGGMPPPDDDTVPRVMRMGTVDDIGNTCVFLCSEAGGWISGDTIQVDGAGFLRRGVARTEEGLSNVDRAAMVAVSRDREKNADKDGGFAQTGLPSARPKL